MWLFSELEVETGIPEEAIHQQCIEKGIPIITGWGQPGNLFLGLGVTDVIGDAIINQSSLEDK